MTITRDDIGKASVELKPEVVHIWYHVDPADTWRSYCGSTHSHVCPESVSGREIAWLKDPSGDRCYCGAPLCLVCKAMFREAVGSGEHYIP